MDVGTKLIVFGLQGIPSPMNPPKLATTQKLFDYGDRVTGIELNVKNIDEVEKIVAKLKYMLDYPHYPKSLFKLYKGLFE
ncbi:MAG: hypothetical protein NTU73_05425 [Ignavibacteriae bacterium]|nr:hypothetical protein [Ignavibacteriota bacterium]